MDAKYLVSLLLLSNDQDKLWSSNYVHPLLLILGYGVWTPKINPKIGWTMIRAKAEVWQCQILLRGHKKQLFEKTHNGYVTAASPQKHQKGTRYKLDSIYIRNLYLHQGNKSEYRFRMTVAHNVLIISSVVHGNDKLPSLPLTSSIKQLELRI